MKPVLVWAVVCLGVALGIALPQWPYGREYGWGLVFYLVAVALLVVSTVWGLLLSWHIRMGFAHIVSLAAFLWSLALIAEVILPRVGYAKVAAAWWYQ
jgi:hypothetical protein